MKIIPPFVESSILLFTVSAFAFINPIFADTSTGISAKLWHELGRGIGNEQLNDLAGYAVATSGSGYTVAVGAPKHTVLPDFSSGNDTIPFVDAGRVRVYQYDPKHDAWDKIGQDIVGESTGDEIGRAIALSEDGTLLAIGAPNCDRKGKREVGCVTIYESEMFPDPDGSDDETTTWLEIGDMIIGESSFDHFGTSLQIAVTYDVIADRETYVVAIGAPGKANQGVVYLYNFLWNEDTAVLEWKLDQIIEDEEPKQMSKFGQSVSMTYDAKAIAVGAPNYGNNNAGIVRLIRQDDGGQWVQTKLPDNLDLNPEEEHCGYSVSLDPSLEYIAYGCPKAISETGKVKFLRKKTAFDGNVTWSRSEIVGVDEENFFGSSVMLSEVMDGHVFAAIGAPKNARVEDGVILQNTGHIKVYYNTDDGDWQQAGLDVEGLQVDDEFGSSVAINKEGHIVIGGAPDGGYAKIFKLDYTAPPTPGPTLFVDNEELEKKRESSVWIVFIISTFSIASLIMFFVFTKRLREHYCGKFKGVSTAEDELTVAGQSNDVGVEMQSHVVSGSDKVII